MRQALAFLTPFGRAAPPTARALHWFPVTGAAIGLAVGGTWWLAAKAWGPAVAAAVAVGADLVLTGLLHVDGLADAADGLLAPMSRSRRLEVMADPAVGAFGVAVVAMVLVLRVAALGSMRPTVLAVAALWCGSRTAMVAVMSSVPYARPGGLAAAFAGGGRVGSALTVAAGLALALVLAVAGPGAHALVALGAEVAGAAGVVWLAWRRLGGFTGDVLGAAALAGETVGLLVLASTW